MFKKNLHHALKTAKPNQLQIFSPWEAARRWWCTWTKSESCPFLQFVCFHCVDRKIEMFNVFTFRFWGCNRPAEMRKRFLASPMICTLYLSLCSRVLSGCWLPRKCCNCWRCWLSWWRWWWRLWRSRWQWRSEWPGDHPWQVAEEEHDDGGDENDGEVAISRLLSCSSLSKFIWLGLGRCWWCLLSNLWWSWWSWSSCPTPVGSAGFSSLAGEKKWGNELRKEGGCCGKRRRKRKKREKSCEKSMRRWGGNGFTSREFLSWGRSKWRGGSILGRWDFW